MPALIISTEESSSPIGASFGFTVVEGALSLLPALGGASHGTTVVTGALAVEQALAGSSAGSTTIGADLRLNDDPNILLGSTIAGTSDVSGSAQLSFSVNGRADGSTSVSGTLRIALATEFGFTIYVDVLDSAIAALGDARRYLARLKADGVEVPIRSFSLSFPSGQLGATLSVQLASPDSALVAAAAVLIFDIGVWNGTAIQWLNLLSGGTLAGRSRSISFASGQPQDTVEISTRDVLGDRWNRAPRTPVILYDPDLIDTPGTPDIQNALKDEFGNAILPDVVPFFGLYLRDVLAYAYVTGCGFASVQTNLLNFPVARAEFTLEGGWDGGGRGLLSAFDPIFAVDADNNLWIFDPDAPLPAGMTAHALPLSAVVSITDTLPAREPVNGLIVAYTENGAGDFFTERIETETSENGTFGNLGFTRTEVSRTIREYRNTDAPTVIVREAVMDLTETTRDYLLSIISREVQQDQFDGMGRKTGHLRTVESLLPALPSGDLLLQTCQTDICSIEYAPNPFRPSEDCQASLTVETSGLCHVDNDNPYRGEPFRLPALDAHRNGFIDPDGDQEYEQRAIQTVRKELRIVSAGQIDLRVTTTDHLADVSKTTSEPVPGFSAIDSKRANQHQVLLTVAGTDLTARRVPTFNAGELPRELAIALGRRKLARLNSPARPAQITLPGIDFAVRQGSVITPDDRAGSQGNFMVTGHTITGTDLGTANQKIIQTLEARELMS